MVIAGGELAALLAARVPQVVAVVTTAGNLDTDAWTQLHGYLPIEGLLNPLAAPPLAPRIVQLHVTGTVDDVVPSALTIGYIARHPNAALHATPGANHHCCWPEHWPAILGLLDERLSRRFAR
ncbi:MAG: hypothetical protein ACI9W2_002014 [Gammaproteobacteria bacterium]